MATRPEDVRWPEPFNLDRAGDAVPKAGSRRGRQARRFATVLAALLAVPLPYAAVGLLWGPEPMFAALALTPAALFLGSGVALIWRACGDGA